MTPADLDRMEQDEKLIPAGPWELWTSCSYRRITGPDGKVGGVLHAYNQRGDGHPDLSMPEDQLAALVRLRNDLPALIARQRQLEAAVERAEEALKPFADEAECWDFADDGFEFSTVRFGPRALRDAEKALASLRALKDGEAVK